ncbi:MAG: tetratricopeptide repeat protein [Chloroflexia bacterium]
MPVDDLPTRLRPPLIRSKVHIPPLVHLVSRPRLLRFLDENVHRKLILVCAGPGYGKTSLLVDFARSTELAVCWYTLDPSDRDPAIFLDYLIEAIRVRFPNFGERTRAALYAGGVTDLRSLVGLFLNELAEEIPEYLVLILDEYHTVEEEDAVNQVVDLLLQFLPEQVHLILASRTVPPLSIIRLVTYGEVAGLGSDSLRFTREEMRELLEHNFQLYLSDEELENLERESEGWVTAIVLGMQATWQGLLGFLTGWRGPKERIYAYLASEVVRHLPPEMRQFLEQVSVLERLDPALCDALLQRSDSAHLLEMLERRNLFLVPLAGGGYRFHGLFREYLLEQARKDPAQFVRLHRRAAELRRASGDEAEAVEHLLQARAFEEAAETIEQLAQRLFEAGRLQTLLRWVEALPEEARLTRPRLLLFVGKALLKLGRGPEARETLLRAEAALAARDDLAGWVQAVADRSTLERLEGNYAEALRLAHEVLPHATAGDLQALVDLHRTIGICLHAQGEMAAAEEHLRLALNYSLAASGPYNQALAYQDLGVCLRAQGRMQEAEEAYQQALARWRRIGSPGPLANTLNNLAMGPFLRGELGEAQGLLEQALEAARTSLSPWLQALVQASLGDLYRDLGALAVARQVYEEGLLQARQARHARLVAYLLDAQANLARRRGAYEEARRLLQEAQAAAGASQESRAQVQVSLGLLEVAQGRPEEALSSLEEAAELLERTGERLQLLRAWLGQSLALERLGRKKEAQAVLVRALELAKEMGVCEPFLAEKELLLPALRRIPREAGNAFLDRLLERMAYRPPQESVGREAPPLRIFALGHGRVFRGEEEIGLKAWGARRARELFFYLFFHCPVRKQEIGTALWPEQDLERITSSFHATLYRARRATGALLVTFRDERYHWVHPDTWCDVAEFERLLAEAEPLPASDPRKVVLLERALSLYQGDFLEDLDSEWCILRREELAGRRLHALLSLGRAYLEQENWPRAEETFLRALEIDNLCEEAYRELMECYVRRGEPARAIQTYRRCRRHLSRELRISPSEETEALYRKITRRSHP